MVLCAFYVIKSAIISILEKWTIFDAWPQAVNWNDLDYSSSEEATVEVTVRYSDVSYDSACLQAKGGCCTSC